MKRSTSILLYVLLPLFWALLHTEGLHCMSVRLQKLRQFYLTQVSADDPKIIFMFHFLTPSFFI